MDWRIFGLLKILVLFLRCLKFSVRQTSRFQNIENFFYYNDLENRKYFWLLLRKKHLFLRIFLVYVFLVDLKKYCPTYLSGQTFSNTICTLSSNIKRILRPRFLVQRLQNIQQLYLQRNSCVLHHLTQCLTIQEGFS